MKKELKGGNKKSETCDAVSEWNTNECALKAKSRRTVEHGRQRKENSCRTGSAEIIKCAAWTDNSPVTINNVWTGSDNSTSRRLGCFVRGNQGDSFPHRTEPGLRITRGPKDQGESDGRWPNPCQILPSTMTYEQEQNSKWKTKSQRNEKSLVDRKQPWVRNNLNLRRIALEGEWQQQHSDVTKKQCNQHENRWILVTQLQKTSWEESRRSN